LGWVGWVGGRGGRRDCRVKVDMWLFGWGRRGGRGGLRGRVLVVASGAKEWASESRRACARRGVGGRMVRGLGVGCGTTDGVAGGERRENVRPRRDSATELS